ncbi:biopolymer transporter ExbD [bacterium]|nr:biopolymer transporter ExbD [bacterium]
MSHNRTEFNEINITPLTDIFLVLLIIMMVIAPLLDQQGLNLTVPENVAQEQVKDDVKILTVTVSSDDRYFIAGEEVQVTDLEKTIAELAKDYPDGLMIESDGDATHGAVVKLMDSARNSGIKSISVSQV